MRHACWLWLLVSACSRSDKQPAKTVAAETCTAATIDVAAIATCEQHCAAKSAPACATAAHKYCRGIGVTKDAKRCLELAQQACDLDSADGCSFVVEVYSGAPDPSLRDFAREEAVGRRMLAMYARDCAAGDGPACIETSTWYDLGPDLPWPEQDRARAAKDFARGIQLEQQACDRGDGYQCALLSVEIGGSKKGPQDHERALALRRRACDLGHAWSCEEAALFFWDDRDALRARACSLGLASSCAQGSAASAK